MPSVKLISHTPEPEKLVAAAGRLCYSPSGVDKLMESLDEEKIAYFVKLLAENGHGSTMEHVSFTFALEGVSRSFLAQITRHRIASYSVQSQRYVKLNNFENVVPNDIEQDPEVMHEFNLAMQNAGEHYNKITELLMKKYQAELEAQGLEPKAAKSKAQKMAIENARAVLPNACETKMLVTMNARGLHNFFAHRCCQRAQEEIRVVADEMLKLVKEVAPRLFKKAGPGCIRGKCPEGNMSCGKMDAMCKKYLEES